MIDSLTDLTDVALVFEDANSILLEVVIVAELLMPGNVLTTFNQDFEAEVW